MMIMNPNIGMDLVKDEKKVKKIRLKFPERIKDVIRCSNPRCITSTEPYVTHSFYLSDESTGEYRCEYCDNAYVHN